MTMNNMIFEQVEAIDDMQEVIKNTFDVELNITGGWGYDNNTAVIANNIDMPTEQFVHMFATIRANIEMNLMVENSDERFSGINVNFEENKEFEIDKKVYQIFTFKITAMNEKIYAELIQEYKDNYGKKEFDLSAHFKRREQITISRVVDYWFYGLKEN